MLDWSIYSRFSVKEKEKTTKDRYRPKKTKENCFVKFKTREWRLVISVDFENGQVKKKRNCCFG